MDNNTTYTNKDSTLIRESESSPVFQEGEDSTPSQTDSYPISDILGEKRIDMIINGEELDEVPVDLSKMTESGLLKRVLTNDEDTRIKMKGETKILKDYCLTCGTTGEILPNDVTECPECHRKFSSYARRLKAEQEKYPSNVFVPEHYRGSTWNMEEALKDKTTKNLELKARVREDPLQSWVNELGEFLVKNNGIMLENKGSCFISAPNGFGKRRFAYTFIKELYKNKIVSSPITLLNDLQITDDKLMQITYLILFSTKYNFQENVDKLDYILNKRKLLGKPTLILSEVEYAKYLTKVDNRLLSFDKMYDIYSMK